MIGRIAAAAGFERLGCLDAETEIPMTISAIRRFAKRHYLLLFVVLGLSCNAGAFADSPVVVDAAGHVVGYFVDQPGICNDPSTMPVYSFGGYLACFLTNGKADSSLQPPGTFGPFQAGYFSSPDCSGFDVQYAVQNAGQTQGGYVVSTSQGLMFAEIPAPIFLPTISAMWVGSPESGSCQAISPPILVSAALLFFVDRAYGILFNRAPYIPPLSVQTLPNTSLLDVIFFDPMDVEYP